MINILFIFFCLFPKNGKNHDLILNISLKEILLFGDKKFVIYFNDNKMMHTLPVSTYLAIGL